jgi:hypothetical protein
MEVIFPVDYKSAGIITDDVTTPYPFFRVLVADSTLKLLHDTLVRVNVGRII